MLSLGVLVCFLNVVSCSKQGLDHWRDKRGASQLFSLNDNQHELLVPENITVDEQNLVNKSLREGLSTSTDRNPNTESESESGTESESVPENIYFKIVHAVASMAPIAINLTSGIRMIFRRAILLIRLYFREKYEKVKAYILKHLENFGQKIIKFMKQYHIEVFIIVFVVIGWFCCFYAHFLSPYRAKKKAKKKLEMFQFLAELADEATTCTDVESGGSGSEGSGSTSTWDDEEEEEETESETESASI